MLGGVALQATAKTVGQFILARMIGKTNCSRYLLSRYSAVLPSVGAGLIFGTIAAPLLITELAYPTQVSYYEFMVAKMQLTWVESSAIRLLGCIIQCGMWGASSVRDCVVASDSDSSLHRLAAWTFLVAYDTASDSTWSWQAPVLGQALGPLLQIFLIWWVFHSLLDYSLVLFTPLTIGLFLKAQDGLSLKVR